MAFCLFIVKVCKWNRVKELESFGLVCYFSTKITKSSKNRKYHEFFWLIFKVSSNKRVTVLLSMIYSNFVNSGVHGHPGQLSTDIDSHIVLLSMEQKAVCQDCQWFLKPYSIIVNEILRYTAIPEICQWLSQPYNIIVN